MRRVLALVFASGFALAGPRLTMPHERAAGAPFAYEPPPGFVAQPKGTDTDEKLWIIPQMVPQGTVPRITTAHVFLKSPVEPADLAKTVGGLPQTFSESGVVWTHRRSETRQRPDGTRVGFIEGNCLPDRKSAPLAVGFRAIQLLFPDDTGTTIVKAYVGEPDAGRIVPLIEASIEKARGVALRLPPPPAWAYVAFGAGGALVGWLLGIVLEKTRRRQRAGT